MIHYILKNFTAISLITASVVSTFLVQQELKALNKSNQAMIEELEQCHKQKAEDDELFRLLADVVVEIGDVLCTITENQKREIQIATHERQMLVEIYASYFNIKTN